LYLKSVDQTMHEAEEELLWVFEQKWLFSEVQILEICGYYWSSFHWSCGQWKTPRNLQLIYIVARMTAVQNLTCHGHVTQPCRPSSLN